MKLRLSTLTLALASTSVMALGVYVAAFRPPLLPGDLRYLGRSLAQLASSAPALTAWLSRVFWVMGGFMFATGLLAFYVAITGFRMRARGAAAVAAVAGAASIGGMAIVDFLISSDFKWQLLLLALLWALAFAFYRLEGAAVRAQRTPSAGAPRALPVGPSVARNQ
jgi:hypothetical protein